MSERPEKVNILLVDDRPEGLVTLEAVLTQPGYNLIKAGSGQEALAQILAHDFSVILMDVQMPDMDGFETARVIKQREKSKDIPIIFVTAINKADRFVVDGYSVGAVDYLFKPFDPVILKSKVAVLVDLYRKNKKVIQQAEALRELERRESSRVLAELELESRRRYQSLADAIPQILWRADSLGVIEYYNHFWHVYSGFNAEKSLRSGWQDSIHTDDVSSLDKKWKDSLKNKTGFETECRIWHFHSASFRWHLLRVVPEFNALSELVGWIGIATDIDDQKNVQMELLKAKEAADAASEAKSRFLANMSHEIRTPLGAMLGFTELMVTKQPTPLEKEEYLTTIRRNGEQLSRIIDEILDLSKVEAGKLDIDCSYMSVVDLMADVSSLMSLNASERGLSLEFSIEGVIPERIYTDPTRLRQILLNIIGNGIKFSPRGTVKVILSFKTPKRKVGGKLCFSISDSGPGLSEEQINNLFQPFSQVDSSMTRRYGGTGLGLALSRRFARALGGDVIVSESQPGIGSTFKVTVDTGDLDGVEYITSLQQTSLLTGTNSNQEEISLAGLKILLVEDSIDNQVIVSSFLQFAGAQVDIANNGLEGMEKALSGDHNLILMDIQMPILDGYVATSKLREQGFSKPILALTAHAMNEERQRCLRVGCNEHLTKPVNVEELIKRVREFALPCAASTIH